MKKILTTLTLTALVASTVAPAQAWSWPKPPTWLPENGRRLVSEHKDAILFAGVFATALAASFWCFIPKGKEAYEADTKTKKSAAKPMQNAKYSIPKMIATFGLASLATAAAIFYCGATSTPTGE